MILIVTNRSDYTADFLILELRRRGAPYFRLNTEDFPERLHITWQISSGDLSGYMEAAGKAPTDLNEIRSIWYRRPVPPAASLLSDDPVARAFAVAESEAALEGILASLGCFWVSDPYSIRRAELKPLQLTVAERAGFTVSPTLLTNKPAAAEEFVRSTQGATVYKPLRRARIIRDDAVHLIFTNPVAQEEKAELSRVRHAAALFQRYVHKEVEVRATVIGDEVFAAAIHSQEHPDARHDWRRVSSRDLRHESHELPASVSAKCVDLVRTLGLRFGAIDLILSPEGEYYFLEINPNGQWAWIQQLVPELPLREKLADLLLRDPGEPRS